MSIIIDKTALLLFCMIILFFQSVTPEYTSAFWITVSVSSFLYAFPYDRVRRILISLYCALIFTVPELLFFLPLAIYDYLPRLPEKEPFYLLLPAPLLAGAAFWFHYRLGTVARFVISDLPPGALLLYLTSGCIFSVILQQKTKCYDTLHDKYRRLRDDDTELQLLLEERAQSLLEKQNNEIYTATLRERNRIAREIHDNVGHMLTRSILMVGALKTVHRDPGIAQPLSQLHDTLNQAMNSIRKSVHNLHDSSVSLEESLRSLIQDFTFCPVTLRYDISFEPERDVKYSMISIAKEALVNIARHSGATDASITAVEHPGFLQFIIRDNGNGSAQKNREVLLDSPGIGLTNIQNRVKSLGGNLNVQCDRGFCIYITIPRDSYLKGDLR